MNRYRVKFKMTLEDLEAEGSKEVSADTFELAVSAFGSPANVQILEVSFLG